MWNSLRFEKRAVCFSVIVTVNKYEEVKMRRMDHETTAGCFVKAVDSVRHWQTTEWFRVV